MFAKLQESTIKFVMSACLCVYMEQLGSHWTDSHEILFLSFVSKSVEEIQVPLKSGINNGYFTLRPIHIFDHFSLSFS